MSLFKTKLKDVTIGQLFAAVAIGFGAYVALALAIATAIEFSHGPIAQVIR